MTAATPVVHVLHENAEWFPPFARALEDAGVPYREWPLDTGAVDLASAPPEGVWWSRFSASSHTRGHHHAKEHTRALLDWVEGAGRRTVNGRAVLELEVSKVAQLARLRAAGLDTPRTVAVVGDDELVPAVERFFATAADGDLLLTKHNQGGKGLGVATWGSVDELAGALQRGELETPVDGVTLLQEYVRPADGSITRLEFVAGELVYAVRADTIAGGFQLCPADACAIGPDGRPVVPVGAQRAPEPGEEIFSLREDVSGLPVAALQRFLDGAGVEIAGVELIEAADGRVVVYDVNTNTNYNAAVEAVAPASGPARIAQFLGRLLTD